MAAGSGGRFDADDIRAALADDRFQAWGAIENDTLLGIVLTELIDYPRLRAMRLVGVSARSPRRWMALLHELEQIARDEFGATVMECMHQRRHAVLLGTGGWREYHVLSEKPLTPGSKNSP